VAGNQGAGILGSGGALDHRLGEVAGLGRRGQYRGENQRAKGRLADGGQDDSYDHDRGDDSAHDAGIRLGRRDVDQESCPPEAAAREVGAGVVGPDSSQQNDDPGSFRAPARKRRSRGKGGRKLARARDEPELGDVDDAGGGQRPGGQTLARILPCERSEGRSDQHRRRYDKCDRRRDGRRCNEQGDDDGGHRAHDHLDRVTGCAQQPEHLERGEQGEEAHDDADPWLTEDQHQQERRKEDSRAQDPLAEHD